MHGIDLVDLELLRESVDLECKLAQGKDARGQVPEDFWPTYSAFANTRGGTILLGVRERGERFEVAGIKEPERIVRDLFNNLNNKQKVSLNLLGEDDISILNVDERSIIKIEVPAANRRQKPIFVGTNPLTGTYRRLHDGDRVCDGETVRTMLAEQVGDTRDGRILSKFGIDDLHLESLRTYRQNLRDVKPEHPYLDKDDVEFLRSIGGWRRDRNTNDAGLTSAGLLMFGKNESILEEFPNYFLDYQERGSPSIEARWIDRVTLDGTWSGNIFDFYRIVYRKLVSDIRVPFVLKEGQRQSETSIHVAVREALVNALVHADYSGRSSIFVVKRPDMFGFRNPGLMRIPVQQAIEGGESDGRNRIIQQMFLLVGAGERAGSGVPKIYKGWSDQHWRAPSLYQRIEPSDQTLLELKMLNLFSEDIIQILRDNFGDRLDALEPDQRLILATAAGEGIVTHGRVSALCDQHPVDLTRMLRSLVQEGFLTKTGRGRGAAYHLTGAVAPSPEAVFGDETDRALGGELRSLGGDLSALKGELASAPPANSAAYPRTSMDAFRRGRQVEGLEYPLIDDLALLDPAIQRSLRSAAIYAVAFQRVPPKTMKEIIRRLCVGRYISLKVLSDIVKRDDKYLRDRIINPMIAEGLILRAFPHAPNDPRQAYASAVDKNDKNA